MREFEIKPSLYKKMLKLFSKDKITHEYLLKKIDEILNSSDLNQYKNLKAPMSEFKRVHIGSFVLIFKYDVKLDYVSFMDFKHHDEAYV